MKTFLSINAMVAFLAVLTCGETLTGALVSAAYLAVSVHFWLRTLPEESETRKD